MERHAQGDAHIFVSVMIVDFQVSFGPHVKVNQTVGRNLVQHVIQKGNTGIGGTFPRCRLNSG